MIELSKFRSTIGVGSTVLKLFPLGDVHLGAPACDIEAFRRTVRAIHADPNAFWVGMGDYHDCILPADPRWTQRVIDWSAISRDARGNWDASDLAEWCVEFVERELKPILTPAKCLGLLEGNHEQSLSRFYFTDLTRRLSKRYDVPCLGQTALVRWLISQGAPRAGGGLKTATIDVFAEHGATGGGTQGNSVNNFLKRREDWDADIYLKGHVHRRHVWRNARFSYGGSRLTHRRQVMALTGTYLKGYDEGELTYSERKALPPVEIGGTVILIKPLAGRHHDTVIEATYTDALELSAA